VWSYTTIPPYASIEWCLVKHRDKFRFTFTLIEDVFCHQYNISEPYIECTESPIQWVSGTLTPGKAVGA